MRVDEKQQKKLESNHFASDWLLIKMLNLAKYFPCVCVAVICGYAHASHSSRGENHWFEYAVHHRMSVVDGLWLLYIGKELQVQKENGADEYSVYHQWLKPNTKIWLKKRQECGLVKSNSIRWDERRDFYTVFLWVSLENCEFPWWDLWQYSEIYKESIFMDVEKKVIIRMNRNK